MLQRRIYRNSILTLLRLLRPWVVRATRWIEREETRLVVVRAAVPAEQNQQAPPEHWAGKVRSSGPPEHWLNMIRERAGDNPQTFDFSIPIEPRSESVQQDEHTQPRDTDPTPQSESFVLPPATRAEVEPSRDGVDKRPVSRRFPWRIERERPQNSRKLPVHEVRQAPDSATEIGKLPDVRQENLSSMPSLSQQTERWRVEQSRPRKIVAERKTEARSPLYRFMRGSDQTPPFQDNSTASPQGIQPPQYGQLRPSSLSPDMQSTDAPARFRGDWQAESPIDINPEYGQIQQSPLPSNLQSADVRHSRDEIPLNFRDRQTQHSTLPAEAGNSRVRQVHEQVPVHDAAQHRDDGQVFPPISAQGQIPGRAVSSSDFLRSSVGVPEIISRQQYLEVEQVYRSDPHYDDDIQGWASLPDDEIDPHYEWEQFERDQAHIHRLNAEQQTRRNQWSGRLF